MDRQQTVLARAFELAKGGECKCVSEIARVLSHEGYDLAYQHLAAPSLHKQLKKLIHGQ